ncbi:hypothetical protein GGQ77_002912 [Geobacillus thermodenitrificans]|nr:hypothetical protein [Geobacillus thermodenitrificans]
MLNLHNVVLIQEVLQSVIEEYKDKIPNQVIEVWTKYGFGSIKVI